MRERARVDGCMLQPFDGRRGAPDRKRMAIRSPDGAALASAPSIIRLIRIRCGMLLSCPHNTPLDYLTEAC